MDYEYSKYGVSNLIRDLQDKDRYSIKNIGDFIGVSRNTVYKYLKLELLMKKYKFEKLLDLRGVSDLETYNYFVERLSAFNPVAYIPDSTGPGKENQRKWIGQLKSIEHRLGEKTDLDVKRIIDFALSSYCPILVQNPITVSTKLPDIVSHYRQYVASTKVGGKNKLQVAEQVAVKFMEEFKKFFRKTNMVITDDNCLAHTIAKLGGCNKISNMPVLEAQSKIKFAYLEFLKHPPGVRKTVIRNGDAHNSIKLKDLR